MNLCKTCMFTEVDKEKEIYWCVLKNKELTNYDKIDNCEDYISNYVKTV